MPLNVLCLNMTVIYKVGLIVLISSGQCHELYNIINQIASSGGSRNLKGGWGNNRILNSGREDNIKLVRIYTIVRMFT